MAFADGQTSATIYYSESGAEILLAGTVTKGDALGFSGGWKRALATTGGVIAMRCTAGSDGVSGDTIIGYFGQCILTGRHTGAAVNGALYVAESSDNGELTQTAPSTTGDSDTIVGYAITATVMLITPSHNPDTVA